MATIEQLRETAYSYYLELNDIIETQYPEISRIHEPDKLQDILRTRAENAAEEYHRILESDPNELSAREAVREILTADLAASYYDEVTGVLEEYPEILRQLKELDTLAYTRIIAELAKRVYLDVNGSTKASTRLYISPFSEGHNNEEEEKIKKLTIKAYNELSMEAYENAQLQGIDLLQ